MDREELLGKRVVVICGGWSDELEISLSSARECRAALLEAGFSVVDLLDLAERDFLSRLVSGGYDVAFVAMHGRWGEDGCVQGLLEILHLPYTFSGVAASAAATEKEVAKAVYAAAGIRAPRGFDVAAGTVLADEQVDKVVESMGLPLFVKPAANGSSFGITRVTERSGLNEAIRVAGAQGGRVLVEVSPEFFRPAEVDLLLGDPTKAKELLGWNPRKTSFEELVKIMTDHDMELVKRDMAVRGKGEGR